jgi:protocatechuate 3,4-dioxygenase beta subunit
MSPTIHCVRTWYPQLISLVFVACASLWGWSATSVGAGSQELSAPQSGQRLEIRGKVIEPGLQQPIQEADVKLFTLPAEGAYVISAAVPREPLQSSKTGPDGSFSFEVQKPGRYRVEVSKEGYSSLGGPLGREFASTATIDVSKDSPPRELRLFLSQPAELTGRVIDHQTGLAVAGLTVRVWQAVHYFGRRSLYSGAFATSGADGRFQAKGLRPGEYVVEIQPRIWTEARLLKEFTDADPQVVDQDMEHSFWPGGTDSKESALPVALPSGGTVDVGNLSLRKVPYFRVRLKLDGANCTPSQTVYIYENVDGGNLELGKAPCRSTVLLCGFSRGSHALEMSVDGASRNSRERDFMSFQVSDRNLDLTSAPKRGIDIAVVIVPSEGSQGPDFSKLGVRLDPIGTLQFRDERQAETPDKTGRLVVPNLAPVRHRLVLSGLGSTHYVKEVRYGHMPVKGAVIPLDSPVIESSLEIVLDDKPAS